MKNKLMFLAGFTLILVVPLIAISYSGIKKDDSQYKIEKGVRE